MTTSSPSSSPSPALNETALEERVGALETARSWSPGASIASRIGYQDLAVAGGRHESRRGVDRHAALLHVAGRIGRSTDDGAHPAG